MALAPRESDTLEVLVDGLKRLDFELALQVQSSDNLPSHRNVARFGFAAGKARVSLEGGFLAHFTMVVPHGCLPVSLHLHCTTVATNFSSNSRLVLIGGEAGEKDCFMFIGGKKASKQRTEIKTNLSSQVVML